MNRLIWKYRVLLQTIVMILPVIWIFNYANDIVKNTLYVFTFVLILFTLFLSFLSNWNKKIVLSIHFNDYIHDCHYNSV